MAARGVGLAVPVELERRLEDQPVRDEQLVASFRGAAPCDRRCRGTPSLRRRTGTAPIPRTPTAAHSWSARRGEVGTRARDELPPTRESPRPHKSSSSARSVSPDRRSPSLRIQSLRRSRPTQAFEVPVRARRRRDAFCDSSRSSSTSLFSGFSSIMSACACGRDRETLRRARRPRPARGQSRGSARRRGVGVLARSSCAGCAAAPASQQRGTSEAMRYASTRTSRNMPASMWNSRWQ